MIQCSRLAFGFVGIFDDDEAQRINEQAERDMGPADVIRDEQPAQLPECPQETADKYRGFVETGKKSASDVMATLESKYTLSDQQRLELIAAQAIEGETA